MGSLKFYYEDSGHGGKERKEKGKTEQYELTPNVFLHTVAMTMICPAIGL